MEVAGLSETMVAAQVRSRQATIASSYRSYRARKLTKAQRHKVRIALPFANAPVDIVGTFLPPPWTLRKRLSYSLESRELFVEAWLKSGDAFLLLRRGQTFLHPDFPATQVASTQHEKQGLVNVFTVTSVPRPLPRPVSWEGALRFRAAVACRGKVADHCEDAHFCGEESLGVADGVSAWQYYGIDSGAFSESLMRECAAMKPQFHHSAIRQELTEALDSAHKRVSAHGSSTVLLAQLVANQLYVTTLGDSRAVLIRWSEGRPAICFKSAEMVHTPNTPYQLANVPPALQSQPFICDSASDALHYSLSPKNGDLLLLGTDGLWDNLSDCELFQILESGVGDLPQDIADRLCSQAYVNSISMGPFAKRATPWRGGKADDITVIVASIASSA